MTSLHVLVLLLGIGILPLAQSRPRDKRHRGLYDDWMPVPYIDNRPIVPDAEQHKTEGNSNVNSQSNIPDTTSQDGDLGEGVSEYNRHTTEEREPVAAPAGLPVADVSDIVPIEGGTENMGSTRPFVKPDQSESSSADTKHHRNKNKSQHRHKGRHSGRKERLHRIDDGGLDVEGDNSFDSQAVKHDSPKALSKEEMKIQEFDLSKFYAENPDFKKNVAVIHDASMQEDISDEDSTEDSITEDLSVGGQSEDSEDSTADDISESVEDDEEEDVDSFSDEDYDDEDYDDEEEWDDSFGTSASYDSDEDDSFDSDEDFFDWNKYDMMLGDDANTDQGKTSATKMKKNRLNSVNKRKDKKKIATLSGSRDEKKKTFTTSENDKKKKPSVSSMTSENDKKKKPSVFSMTSENEGKKKNKPQVSMSENDKKQTTPGATANLDSKKKKKDRFNTNVPTLSKKKDKKKKAKPAISELSSSSESQDQDGKGSGKDDKKVSVVPKTNVEPSTSPNPPTEKKDWESTVTQPVYPRGKDQPEEHVTYIESKPIEACDIDGDCPPGRICKFGLCICGQTDLCSDHRREVCGSDGVLYPSHCELHRTACIKGDHIQLDITGSCKPAASHEVAGLRGDNKDDKEKSKLLSENTKKDEKKDDRKKIVDKEIQTSTNLKPENTLTNENASKKNNNKEDRRKVGGSETDKDGKKKKVKPQNTGNTAASVATESENSKKMLSKKKNDEEKMQGDAPADDKVRLGGGELIQLPEVTKDDNVVPLSCTPDQYLQFKAKVLLYHCIFFDEDHCDTMNQEGKQRLASVMFNYFDRDLDGFVEMEELWEMQLRENMDQISSLCSMLDLVELDELGTKDFKLSPEEFLQAFDIPDVLEHRHELVTMTASVGNTLEIQCGVAVSTNIIWKRNEMDLALLDYPGVTVLEDGSLYIDHVGLQHIGNLTCYERSKPSIKETHTLLVTKIPEVSVSPPKIDVIHGDDVVLRCHAEGVPHPKIEWRFNGFPLDPTPKYHVHAYDQTLTVYAVDEKLDTGKYTCVAENLAGQAMASSSLVIHAINDTNIPDDSVENSFVVFHDNGYTMHEPDKCMTQRHVKPDFGNFHFLPDELDQPPRMCPSGAPCVWGQAVNVKNMFIYATQPRQNRLLVIDLKNTLNPDQVIDTDRIPVSLQYIEYLDEVWVLCWNGEDDFGSKTIVIIRDASQRAQHHPIHTQPIGNRFDLVQEVFLPPATELRQPYQFGYTVHNGQQGLFKVDLAQKRYIKAVDFSMFACVPKALAFVPIGGHVMVQCHQRSARGEANLILTMDYVTDMIVDNKTMPGTPYVTPDSRQMVIVDEATGKVTVYKVSDKGEITEMFDVTTGSPISDVAFHRSGTHQGYDLFLTSSEGPVIFLLSLLNGRVDAIKDTDEPSVNLQLPWLTKSRPLVSGGAFSNYLATLSMSSMVIVNGKHQDLQCDFAEVQNPAVAVFCNLL